MSKEKIVIVPDIHGQIEILDALISEYDGAGVNFLFLGDILDGRTNSTAEGIYNSMERIRRLGDQAVLLLGNHEIAVWAAMSTRENQEEWVQAWSTEERGGVLRGYEHNTLRAYGVESDNPPAQARELRQAMSAAGHLALIENAEMYYEGDNFIAVHAGFTSSEPLRSQMSEMDQYLLDSRVGNFKDIPVQIVDFALANDELSHPDSSKAIVTGHSHITKTAGERITDNGQRVRLASRLHLVSTPLFVWENWSERVVMIEPDY